MLAVAIYSKYLSIKMIKGKPPTLVLTWEKYPSIPGVQAKRAPYDKFLFNDMRAFSLPRRKQLQLNIYLGIHIDGYKGLVCIHVDIHAHSCLIPSKESLGMRLCTHLCTSLRRVMAHVLIILIYTTWCLLIQFVQVQVSSDIRHNCTSGAAEDI